MDGDGHLPRRASAHHPSRAAGPLAEAVRGHFIHDARRQGQSQRQPTHSPIEQKISHVIAQETLKCTFISTFSPFRPDFINCLLNLVKIFT